MKFINASERLPENKKWNYIFRQKGNSRSAKVVYLDFTSNISAFMQLPLDQIEWLDETDESPSSDPAEVLELRQWKKEATELLNPIMEYGQTHPDCKPGSSTTEFVLNRAKGAEVLVKALKKVLNPDYTQSQKQWAAEDALKQYEQLKSK